MVIRKLYIELTNRCNLNCTICYRKSWSNTFADMSSDIFYKLWEDIRNCRQIKEIVLGGIGEPTFSPLICEAIEKLKEYHLTITTNGTLMDDELMDRMIKYVDVVTVSIDGLDKKFKDIRGAELSRVIDNLKKLNEVKEKQKSQRPIINIQFVASMDSMEDIFGVIDLASSLKSNTVLVSNLIPQSEKNANKILYKKYENKKMKDLFDRIRNYSFKRGISLIFPNCELKTERRCNFIDESTTFVCANGDVVPCYRFSHGYKEYIFGREKQVYKYSFGNVNEKALGEIWNSKEYVDFRRTVYNNLYPSCIDCDLVEGCDMAKDTEVDCYGVSPSCGDCLWARKFIICP